MDRIDQDPPSSTPEPKLHCRVSLFVKHVPDTAAANQAVVVLSTVLGRNRDGDTAYIPSNRAFHADDNTCDSPK